MACRNLGQSAGLPAATSLAHRDCSVAHSICNNLPICGRYALSSEAARGGMGAKIAGGSTAVGARRKRRQNVMVLGGVGRKRSTGYRAPRERRTLLLSD